MKESKDTWLIPTFEKWIDNRLLEYWMKKLKIGFQSLSSMIEWPAVWLFLIQYLIKFLIIMICKRKQFYTRLHLMILSISIIYYYFRLNDPNE